MNKLKALSATALVAGAIGIGGLATAPTASAMPSGCWALSAKAHTYRQAGDLAWGYGYYSLANFYYGQSRAYGDLAIECFAGL